ncbi:MAG: type I-U CRISPR-associated protein Csx17 [Pseudomonadota bacterium]
MTLHVIRLGGCTPRPLAGYLKALGVFRCIAEQKDSRARALWRDDVLHLASSLDEQALLEFFLAEWEPSPFVSPWNKGSGFFNENDRGIAPIEASTAPRFARLRAGIAAARALITAMDEAVQAERAIKDESKGLSEADRDAMRADPVYKARLSAAAKAAKQLKDDLQPECQKAWRGDALRWLRAAVVLDADGAAAFPGLLGTGGNDGKLEFTNNAMQRLGDLFDLADPEGSAYADALPRLRAALFGEVATGLIKGAIGQFSPADSGGPNAGSGPLADSRLNPWDLPLLLEGSLLFTASSNRRLLGRDQPRIAAPFVLANRAAGAPTEIAGEESTRGEQWMPLWNRTWSLPELRAVLSEGRSQLGARAGADSLDMARAVARLGVARGITSFERYGYIQRNGKSNYAVPLGRWLVEPNPHAGLLDDLERHDWWSRLQRAARGANAPASVSHLERRLADQTLAALRHGGEPTRWRAVALTLAQVEAAFVRSEAFTAKARLGPLPPLSPSWLAVLDDGRPELRLALALAGAAGPSDREGVRAHWLPALERPGRFATSTSGLRHTTRQVVHGRDAEADLIAIVERRLVEAEVGAARTLPLPGIPGLEARLSDLQALVAGSVDLEQTLWLARFLAAMEGVQAAALPGPSADPGTTDPIWATVRLANLAVPLRPGVAIPVDPAVVRLLASGEAGRAVEIARRRLGSVGIRPPFSTAILAPAAARRIAASLAFPIAIHTARDLARRLHPTSDTLSEEARHVR